MRSGRYINEPRGIQGFHTKSSPARPLEHGLGDAGSAVQGGPGARQTRRHHGNTSNPDLFVAMYIKQEAVLSSQIEGTQASLLDVLEFESELSRSASSDKRDVYEVINYISAFNYGLERLKTLPMSLRLMKEIHARLLQNVRGAERDPGEFRNHRTGSAMREAC